MNTKKIIAAAIFGVLIIGLLIWNLLRSSIHTKAAAEVSPQKIRITNISDNTFTVSWITPGTQTLGVVLYGADESTTQVALDDRDTQRPTDRMTHHVTIKHLLSTKKYFYKIKSGEKVLDNGGKSYEQFTAPTTDTTPPVPDVVYGTVSGSSGSSQGDTIEYMTVGDNSPLSTIGKKDGSWLITLTNSRTKEMTEYAHYSDSDLVTLLVSNGEAELEKKVPLSRRNELADMQISGGVEEKTKTPNIVVPSSIPLDLKVKFFGISSKIPVSKISIKIVLSGKGLSTPLSQSVLLVADSNGVWTGSTLFASVSPGSGYIVTVKGPKYLPRTVCQLYPKEEKLGTYACSKDASITLNEKQNTIDLTELPLLPGDLGDQDGEINSYDVSLLRNNLSSTDPVVLKSADVNYDGVINAQDYSLVVTSLEVRPVEY